MRSDVMPLTPTLTALGKLGNEQTAALLLVGLRHGHPAARSAAAEALLRIFTRGPTRAFATFVPPLAAAYLVDEDPLTRVWLYAALAHLGAEPDAARLRSALGLKQVPAPRRMLDLLLARR